MNQPLHFIASALLLVGGDLLIGAALAHDSPSPRANTPLTIPQMNDVYSTQAVSGGLARVATLANHLRQEARTDCDAAVGRRLSIAFGRVICF
jgi:hypothetical protein